MKSEWQTINVEDGTKMRLYTCRPESTGPRPAVMVLQEIFGVNSHIRDVCHRVSDLGYVAVAPELFHRTAPPGFEAAYTDFAACRPHMEAINSKDLSADFKSTYAYLTELKEVDAKRIGAIGFCMGGRVAFMANAVVPLKCAVSYYGSRIPTLADYAGKLNGPMLFCWGGKDAGIDLAQREQVRSMLRSAGKSFVDAEFSDADHGFYCDQRASYQAPSARQAWALTTQFFADSFA